MTRLQCFCFSALFIASGWNMDAALSDGADLEKLGLAELETHLRALDAELEGLSEYSLRSGIGSIGYRSADHQEANKAEWIQIELEKVFPLDEIVLVPAVLRDTKKGFRADAFPLAFRILAGTNENPIGTVLAEFTPEDSIDPGISPLIVSVSGVNASWVRIEVSQLSTRAFDGLYVLQLSEVMVFSGVENVALRQPVATRTNSDDFAGAWDQRFLVDGTLPYLMNSAEGSQSIAYVSPVGDQPALIIDLERSYPISRIHLHAVDQSDTVPQAYAGDLGIPYHLVIEGAQQADFENSQTILDFRRQSVNDAGPITMWRVPETMCRYVRITAAESSPKYQQEENLQRIGFAEVELFANGKNVARGKSARTNLDSDPVDYIRKLEALTDGHNLYGEILPDRKWIQELARRHELESQRPLILDALTEHYAQQKKTLSRLSWLTIVLAVGLVFLFLIDRILRLREITRIRERFAADLHDELGANLHTIGLLSDLAEDSKDSPEDLAMLHQRIRNVTERTGTAMRHCTDILEAKGLYKGFRADMQQAARRIMAKLEHSVSIEGESFLEKLSPRTRVDLFLFYKECLVNISRHAEATRFETRLKADAKQVHLQISDNGRGLSDLSENGIPKSLKRRARLLRAKVSVENPADGGTSIHLHLKTSWWLQGPSLR